MKTRKCKCGYRFKISSYEEDQQICFSCQCNRGYIYAMAIGMTQGGKGGEQSKKYWGDKLFELLNNN